jgi:hypothetical protein
VRLGPGEVLERRTTTLSRHEPQIGLKRTVKEHTGFRLTAGQHALDPRGSHECVHQRRIAVRGQEVQVTTRVSSSSQAADRRESGTRNGVLQIGDQRRGDRIGI